MSKKIEDGEEVAYCSVEVSAMCVDLLDCVSALEPKVPTKGAIELFSALVKA